jgi:hypothetical protein
MKTKPQFASATVAIPVGFSGWWCERCERPAENIPAEAGSPAKCPHCRKWTVVWVPATEPVAVETPQEGRALQHGNWERVRPTAERARELFAAMHASIEGALPGPGELSADDWEQQTEKQL